MISLIGTGAMGGALLAGWIAAGVSPGELGVVDTDLNRLAEVQRRFGVSGLDLAEAGGAELVVLAVKPAAIRTVLTELKPHLGAETLVVSIAAGVRLADLNAIVDQVVVRVMPNTPALVGQGVSGISAGPGVSEAQLLQVVRLMSAVGTAVVVPEEQLDALTAISGSGPAYLFLVAEAMIEAGVHQGLGRELAAELVHGTLAGAANMLITGADSATVLRERVTSPAGTTAAALRIFEERGLRAAFLAAVEAAAERSRGL